MVFVFNFYKLVVQVNLLSYRPEYEQIFKPNYIFFNNNLKNEINQTEWKTLFDSHEITFCFENFFNILTCVFDKHVPVKKLSKKEKCLIDKL